MKKIMVGVNMIPYLLVTCVLSLASSAQDSCRFYETLYVSQSQANDFIVENNLDPSEDTSAVLYESGQSTTRTGDALYRITRDQDAPFRPIRVCVTVNMSLVIFRIFDENGDIHRERAGVIRITGPTQWASTHFERRLDVQLTFRRNMNVGTFAEYAADIKNLRFLVQTDQICMETLGDFLASAGTATQIQIHFRNTVGLPYEVSDLLVEGCMGERVCGWSQYEDAGIEGGSIPQQTVVGGWVARPSEFPWQALLFIDSSFICGGVVIDSRYVLTAAHCVHDKEESDLLVILGNEQLSVVNSNQQHFEVAEIITHVHYVDGSLYNDIALLLLSHEIPAWTEAVQPICLPQQPVRDIVGVHLTVSGWGHTVDGGVVSDDLMYTTGLPAMSFHACESCQNDYYLSVASNPADIVLDGMMCAGHCGANSRDACNGDSGGPLSRKNEEDGWELVGLVSWGFGCAFSVPGVYTDVFFYRHWIVANTPAATLPFFTATDLELTSATTAASATSDQSD